MQWSNNIANFLVLILINGTICLLFYRKLKQTIRMVDFSNHNNDLIELAKKNFLLALVSTISTAKKKK